MNKSVAFVPVLLIAALGLTPAAHAQAAKNSAAAAKTLAAAQAASKANRWAECIAKAREAQGVAGKNAYDDFISNELIGFCATRSNDFATAVKAYETNLASSFVDAKALPARNKAILQLYYSMKSYPKVIEYGQKMIKDGSADADTYLLVAQTYYQTGDNKATRDFVGKWIADQERRGQRPRENAIQMYVTACMKLKDEACTAGGFEKLVTYYPNPAGWANLMQSLFASRNDAAAFGAYRLAMDVGAMGGASDYTEMAQRAIEMNIPAEAQKTLEAAFAKKAFTEKRDIDRNTRLLNAAKERAAASKAGVAKQERDAAAGKSGDADLAVGQVHLSLGDAASAVKAIQRGIAKGNVTNVAEAQLVLGIAQLRAGNKAEASKAFKAVKGDADLERVAKLWALRAQ
ncbi:MAG: hypothetical protein ACO3P5_04980 [Steroidobacteraceae bacterium]